MREAQKVKKTLVMGGSMNHKRYSNKAIRKLRSFGYPTVSVGNREGTVEDVLIRKGMPDFDDIHTITLYLSAKNQKEYYDYILHLRPERIIFNPGAENEELRNIARQNHINVVENCTLILLDTNTF